MADSDSDYMACEDDDGDEGALGRDTVGAPSKNNEGVSTRDSDKKRKGSPLQLNPMKKQNSLPDISRVARKERKKDPPKSFAEMVKMTFSDKSFTKTFTPTLYDMVSPLIERSIASAVSSAIEGVKSSILQEILNSNRDLKETISNQNKTIAEQNNIISQQGKIIDTNKSIIDDLEGEVQHLNMELESLKMEVNNLEQYSRRNSVRFNNLNIDPDIGESELTRSVTRYINSNILTENEQISESDIERCHPVGKAGRNSKRQIIVKFSSYKVKARVFSNKSKLKNNPDKTFMTEDLTVLNHEIVKSLLPLKKGAQN